MKNKRSSAETGTRAELRRKSILIGVVALASLFIAALSASTSFSSPALLLTAQLPSTALAHMVTQHEISSSLLLSSSSSSLSALTTSTTTSESSSLSSLNSIPTSTSPDFRIAYSKIGVSSGSYQRILYDSETNSLRLTNISTAINDNESGRLSMSQGQSQSQSNKQVSESDQKNLQQMVEQNGFFEANSMYPPPDTAATENYDSLYILSIEMDNRAHTVIWTDTSGDIPTGILSIARAIEKISSAQQ